MLLLFKILMGLGLLLMFTFLATAHVWMVPKNTVRRKRDYKQNQTNELPDNPVNEENN